MIQINLAPIVLFVYNRPWHTQKTIEALQKNRLAIGSELFIYSDAPKTEIDRCSVDKVRDYINSIDGFKKITVIKREKNWGLANSIIDGVTNIVERYGKIIVLEDDLVTSPNFLPFMNNALDFYQGKPIIYSVTGFSFSSEFMGFSAEMAGDVYVNIRPMSWGWATWKDRWSGIDWEMKGYNKFMSSREKVREFNRGGSDLAYMLKSQMNGRLDSWYIRWCYDSFLKGKYTVYPKISFVNNVGHDNTGVHCGFDDSNVYSHSELNLNKDIKFDENCVLDQKIVSNFNKAFNISFLVRMKIFAKKVIQYAKNF